MAAVVELIVDKYTEEKAELKSKPGAGVMATLDFDLALPAELK